MQYHFPGMVTMRTICKRLFTCTPKTALPLRSIIPIFWICEHWFSRRGVFQLIGGTDCVMPSPSLFPQSTGMHLSRNCTGQRPRQIPNKLECILTINLELFGTICRDKLLINRNFWLILMAVQVIINRKLMNRMYLKQVRN